MSFILDALKKSETERQQQDSAEFSSVPTSSDKPNPARWLWMLAALLGVNLAVLIGVLMRPDSTPTPIVAEESAATITSDAPASFEERVAEAIEELPEISETQPVGETAAAIVAPTPRPASTSGIATIDQLRLDGSLQLAELHLDIHVFSDDPAGRFVFINMVKHREQSRLAEGPVVKEIRPDGVILEYQGRSFLLPRE